MFQLQKSETWDVHERKLCPQLKLAIPITGSTKQNNKLLKKTPVLHMLTFQLKLTASTLLFNFYTANSAVLLFVNCQNETFS